MTLLIIFQSIIYDSLAFKYAVVSMQLFYEQKGNIKLLL